MHPVPSSVLKNRVDTALGWLLTVMMGAAVLNVLWQVFTRYVLSAPSAYTDELSRYLLIWVGLLGGAYAAGKRMHLAIDLLPTKLEGRSREALGMLIEALIGSFALAVMVVGGLRLVALTLMLEQTSAALEVPLGYVYLALPVSGGLIVFYAGLFFLDHLRAFRGGRPALAESGARTAEAFAEEVNDAVPPSPRPLSPAPRHQEQR